LHGKVALGVEADEVDRLVRADPGSLGSDDPLRCNPLDASEVRLRQYAGSDGQVGRFDRQQGCRDVGQSPFRDDQQIRPEPGEADPHTRFDATHERRTGKHDPTADRHGRNQQQCSRLAPA
jgi:hypothetical protein